MHIFAGKLSFLKDHWKDDLCFKLVLFMIVQIHSDKW